MPIALPPDGLAGCAQTGAENASAATTATLVKRYFMSAILSLGSSIGDCQSDGWCGSRLGLAFLFPDSIWCSQQPLWSGPRLPTAGRSRALQRGPSCGSGRGRGGRRGTTRLQAREFLLVELIGRRIPA